MNNQGRLPVRRSTSVARSPESPPGDLPSPPPLRGLCLHEWNNTDTSLRLLSVSISVTHLFWILQRHFAGDCQAGSHLWLCHTLFPILCQQAFAFLLFAFVTNNATNTLGHETSGEEGAAQKESQRSHGVPSTLQNALTGPLGNHTQARTPGN